MLIIATVKNTETLISRIILSPTIIYNKGKYKKKLEVAYRSKEKYQDLQLPPPAVSNKSLKKKENQINDLFY